MMSDLYEQRVRDWQNKYDILITNFNGVKKRLSRDGLPSQKKALLESELQRLRKSLEAHYQKFPQS